MVKNILITLGLVLSATPVLADGIELPRKVNPNTTGSYSVRAVVTTTNSVRDLNYNIFETKNGIIGAEVPNVVKRPQTMNTTAGEKRPVLFLFDYKNPEVKQLAMCMYTVPPKASEVNTSQMIAAFRYCKLFSIRE